MTKVLNFFLSLFYFIAFCILGWFIGAGIGYGFLILDAQDTFSSWELLSGNHQFEKIVSADSQTVWAQASDGKVYSWNTNCYLENCNQWVEAKEIPENDFEYDTGETLEISNSCNIGDRVQKTPGQVIECAHFVFSGAGFGTSVYYALLDDGQIWAWEHTNSSIGFEVVPLFFGFLGTITGIIGFIIFMIRRAMKNKETPTSPI